MKHDVLFFEWDERKNRENFRKHRIRFETARLIFNDERRIEIYDEDHSSPGEDRYCTIGMVEDVLFVVYTERGEFIRLISARRATKEERGYYFDR